MVDEESLLRQSPQAESSAVRVFTDTWLFKSIFSYFVCFQRTSYWDLKALTKILRLLAILFIALM